jgi:anti-sigma regulatory factor (Ser/Thr protein kinase)
MNHPVPQLNASARTFTRLLSSTRRGAHLARLLSITELQSWGAPQDLTERAALVVTELAANAALHGRAPGRCFRLTLAFDPSPGRLRVEVTDARGDLRPQLPPAEAEPDALRSGGRGLSSPLLPTTGTQLPPRPAARPCGSKSPLRPTRGPNRTG